MKDEYKSQKIWLQGTHKRIIKKWKKKWSKKGNVWTESGVVRAALEFMDKEY